MTDTGRLRAALEGRYTIEREVGAGGMATVYLALDTKHRRRVAVKVLRHELAVSLGAQRFHREIEVAAQLQHPHILPLLDSGDADGFLYYVMPFVEGESLRGRLAREGELPIHDAVRLLIEVVDALSHAHAKGVVHRDIKPDNVLLSGRHALIVDFGVAKALSEATGRTSLTSIGIALGTPSYMAPEQATADPHIDHRVDIYAVGALAYELLSGHPPFAGRSPQEILAAQVTQTPDPVNKMRASIPPALNDIVMKCLAKRPADRWQSAEQLLAQLEPLLTPSLGTTPAQTRPWSAVSSTPSRSRAFKLAAGALVLAAAAATFALLPRDGPSYELGTAQPLAVESSLEVDPAISPDGKSVAYVAGPISAFRIYVRQVGSRANPVSNDTVGRQRFPKWSPDGTRLLYIQRGIVFVVPAMGGVARPLISPNNPVAAADWSPDGTRVAYISGSSLWVKPLEGGEATRLIEQEDISGITWSPDGQYIAYVSGDSRFSTGSVRDFGNMATSQIKAIRVEDGPHEPELVTTATSLNTSPAWLPGSRALLFVSNRDGPRDVYSATLGGSTPSEAKRVTTGLNPHSVSVSKDGGQMAYSAYTARSNVWAFPIRDGRASTMADGRQITTGNQLIEAATISADGKSLIYDSDREGPVEVYRMPIEGGEPIRLTNDPAAKYNPSESSDGKWVVFHSFKYGNRDIFAVPSSGGEMVRLTTDTLEDQWPTWSPSGKVISFHRYARGGERSTMILERKPDETFGEARTLKAGTSITWVTDSTYVRLEGRAVVVRSLTGRFIDTVFTSVPPGRQIDGTVVWFDGHVYFRQYDQSGTSSISRVRMGGQPVQLVRLDDPMRPGQRSEFTTDGKAVYTAIAERQSDVYVVQLMRQ